jgi:soluble lytic murein transglycosylase-like protein
MSLRASFSPAVVVLTAIGVFAQGRGVDRSIHPAWIRGRVVYTNFGAPAPPPARIASDSNRRLKPASDISPNRASTSGLKQAPAKAEVRPGQYVAGGSGNTRASHSLLRPPPQRIERLLDDAANRYRMDPNLVREVARQESGFDPRSVSNKGALGVMQLMPDTARGLGVTDAFDPAQNIDAGTHFLSDLYHQYDGNLPLTLAAYNAGPGAVARYHQAVPPYAETQDYVRVITRRYRAGSTRKAPPPIVAVRDRSGRIIYTDMQ